MGIKQSVRIETPPFNQQQWIYVKNQTQYPEEYGYYKVLQNIKSNQKIDEYQVVWANEEDYEYYIKFFNWRHSQSNVVNTKYIVNNSQTQICSQTYTAKVYIQHMKVRLSEISDIPYPQNLYVLMQALEGYKQIFKLSNYFQIEENQICVDQLGNVKVWVNEDLSINYLNTTRQGQDRLKGQQSMIERLIYIIAENTDQSTQPSPSFSQSIPYKVNIFNKKDLIKLQIFNKLKFQSQIMQGRIIRQYRINQIEIPIRFQSVITMDKDIDFDQRQEISATSLHNDRQHGRQSYQQQDFNRRNNLYNQNRFNSSQLYNDVSSPNTVSNYSQNHNSYQAPHYNPTTINEKNHDQLNYLNLNQTPRQYQQLRPVQYINPYPPQQIQYRPPNVVMYPSYVHNQIPLVNRYPVQQNIGQPINHIPHYIKIQNPLRQISSNVIQYQSPHKEHQSHIVNPPPLFSRDSNHAFQQQLQFDNEEAPKLKANQESKSRKLSLINELNGQPLLQITHKQSKYNNNQKMNHNNNDEQEYQEDYIEMDQFKDLQPINMQNKYHHQRNNTHDKMNQFNQNDGLVARSLPIQGDYPRNGQQLSTMGQQRAIYSHIQQDHWNNINSNPNGFGLINKKESSIGSNSHMKLKDSSLSQQKQMMPGTKKSIKPIKYYYSLQEQLQIDPDIAADLARYL